MSYDGPSGSSGNGNGFGSTSRGPRNLPPLGDLALPDTLPTASNMRWGNPVSAITETFRSIGEASYGALPPPHAGASALGLSMESGHSVSAAREGGASAGNSVGRGSPPGSSAGFADGAGASSAGYFAGAVPGLTGSQRPQQRQRYSSDRNQQNNNNVSPSHRYSREGGAAKQEQDGESRAHQPGISPDAITRGLVTVEQARRYFAL